MITGRINADVNFWKQAWNEVIATLNIDRDDSKQFINSSALRISQLDAELLDEELVKLLQSPLTNAATLINPSWKTKFEPEINLIMRLTLYRFSVWNTGASYGANLQGLRYLASENKFASSSPLGIPRQLLVLHITFDIIIPYLHQRLRMYALSNSWSDRPRADGRRKIWDIMTQVESTRAILSMANFFLFIWNGRYRTLADRLVRLRLLSSQRTSVREVSYEFMNRQMVWHAFTEFILFIFPLFNGRVVRRFIKHFKSRMQSASSRITYDVSTLESAEELIHQKERYYLLPMDQCAICADNNSITGTALFSDTPVGDTSERSFVITSPCQTTCRHIYCYYCVIDRIIRSIEDGENGWECLRCRSSIRSCWRVTGLINSEEAKSSDDWESDDEGMVSLSSDISLSSEPNTS